MPSKLVRSVIAAVAASAILVGCGGASKVSARDYASSVCTATGTWVKNIQAESQQMASAITGSPANGKQEISKFLNQVIGQTDTLISKLKDAGTPDVTNGDRIATTFLNAFEQAKTGLESLRGDVSNLPTNDPAAFATAAKKLSDKITQVFNRADTAMGGLKSPELEKAGNGVKACQSLGS